MFHTETVFRGTKVIKIKRMFPNETVFRETLYLCN
jgi:hypothetical protein